MTEAKTKKGVALYLELKKMQSGFYQARKLYIEVRGTEPLPRNKGKERTHKLQSKLEKHLNRTIQAQTKLDNVQRKWDAFIDKLSHREKLEFEQAIVLALKEQVT